MVDDNLIEITDRILGLCTVGRAFLKRSFGFYALLTIARSKVRKDDSGILRGRRKSFTETSLSSKPSMSCKTINDF